MKRLFSIFAFFSLVVLLTTPVFSQTEPGNSKVKLSLGPIYEDDRYSSIFNLMRDADGNIYVFKSQAAKRFSMGGQTKTVIEKYGPDLKQKYSEDLTIAAEDDLLLHNVYALGGKIIAFSKYYNKSKDIWYFFASELNEKGVIEKPKKVAEIESSSKYEGSFGVYFSQDSTKILVAALPPNKRKENEKMTFVMLDRQFNELWKSEVTLPYRDSDVRLSGFHVNNDGAIYILASVETDSKSSKEADWVSEIFIIRQGEKQPKRLKIDFPEKQITGLTFLERPDGNVILAGAYEHSSNKRFGKLGTIFIEIDGKTSSIVKTKVSKFKAKTFNWFNIKEAKIEKGNGINSLDFNDAWISKTGEIWLDFEQNTIYTSKNSTTYTSWSGLVVKYSAAGELVFESVIPKKMAAINTRAGLGHMAIPTDDGGAIFVYNDHPDNVTEKMETDKDLYTGISGESGGIVIGKATRKTDAVLATISPEGKLKRKALFSTKEKEVMLQASTYLKYAPNVYLVPGRKKTDFRLVKLEF